MIFDFFRLFNLSIFFIFIIFHCKEDSHNEDDYSFLDDKNLNLDSSAAIGPIFEKNYDISQNEISVGVFQ